MNSSRTELLESRIAPATILPGGKVMTYTDVDGDLVKVTITKGTLTLADFGFDVAGGMGAPPQQLRLVDFSGDADKAGTNLTFAVTRKGTGDGFAHVGFINATGVDLGIVTVKGDLGRIFAGDADAVVRGLGTLTVQSLGEQGTGTQGGGTLVSSIVGGMKSLVVKGNINGAEIDVVRASSLTGSGTLGSLFVGGSMIGNAAEFSGGVFTTDDLLKVTVKGDVRGGSGPNSGQIAIGGKAGPIVIGGSLIGGAGGVGSVFDTGSGAILSGRNGEGGPITSILIAGEIQGGSGFASGSIHAGVNSESGPVGSITIKGSVKGGDGAESGRIFVTDSVGTLTIGGSLLGGAGTYTFDEDARGQIFVEGNIKTLKIAGDMRGGPGPGASGGRVGLLNGSVGSFTLGGSIVAGPSLHGAGLQADSIGPVKIGRDLDGRAFTFAGAFPGIRASNGNIASVTVGGSIFEASILASHQLGPVTVKGSIAGRLANPVTIHALGQEVQSAKADVAIKSIKVGGNMQFTEIKAGYNIFVSPFAINPDAQIGPVTVGGDWLASTIVAGVDKGGDAKFGTADDAKAGIAPDNAQINSRIASIVIKGQAVGSLPVVSNTDHFGFVAQEIGALSIGGVKFTLTAGTATRDVIELSPFTTDLTVREIAI
jgi:hypothetical protein